MEAEAHELTAAYALDALDRDEREAYERHLATCERCRDELAALWEATEALAVAATGPAPAPELRDRVLAAARAEPHVVVPLAPRRQRVTPVLAAAAALAAAVALVVGLWGLSLSSDLDETRAALERERATASILADPRARTVPLQEGSGRLVVAQDGRAVVVLDGLEPAPAGKTYQLWLVNLRCCPPQPAGLFPGDAGTDVVLLDRRVEDGFAVAVTLEDAGGVEAPTSDPVAASEPV